MNMENCRNFGGLLACLGLVAILTACGGRSVNETPDAVLKSVLADKFLIGVAVNSSQAAGLDSIGAAVIKKHFN